MKKKKLNLNEIAKLISEMEKGKEEISIAQVKEVMKNFLLIVQAVDASLQGHIERNIFNSVVKFREKNKKQIIKKALELETQYKLEVLIEL